MIDGGANGDFISKAFVTQQSLPSQPQKSFKIIYGNGSEEICESSATVQLNNINEFSELTQLSVANIFEYDIILGKPWLKQYNPNIDWITNKVSFEHHGKNVTFSPQATISTSDILISAIQTKRCVRKEEGHCHLLLIKSSIQNNTHDTSLDQILTDYGDIFSENQPDGLPPQRSYDHRIKIFPASSPPSRAPYTQINELMEKGHIRPSCSPFGAPVYKKRRNKKDVYRL